MVWVCMDGQFSCLPIFGMNITKDIPITNVRLVKLFFSQTIIMVGFDDLRFDVRWTIWIKVLYVHNSYFHLSPGCSVPKITQLCFTRIGGDVPRQFYHQPMHCRQWTTHIFQSYAKKRRFYWFNAPSISIRSLSLVPPLNPDMWYEIFARTTCNSL
jgi:hypothetical protein